MRLLQIAFQLPQRHTSLQSIPHSSPVLTTAGIALAGMPSMLQQKSIAP